MALDVVYPQWRDERRHDASPFAARAETPDGLDRLFVDAVLHLFGGDGFPWLSALEADAAGVRVEVTDGSARAAGTLPAGSTEDVIRLYAVPTGQPAGVLVGREPGFPGLGAPLRAGRREYAREETEFAVGAVIPLGRGLLSCSAEGGLPLTGVVTLMGEHGVRLRQEDGEVVVDVLGASSLGEPDENGLIRRQGLRTVSGIPPNGRGEWKFVPSLDLAGDSILRISGGEHSLTFSLIGKT